MQIKHLNSLARIENHYSDIHLAFKNGNLGLLETWNLFPPDWDNIQEEAEALRYLLGCRLGLVHLKTAHKPSLVVVQRLFERHLSYLDLVHGCHPLNYLKHPNKSIQKDFLACRHYKFQISLPAWYEKLPDKIQSFEEKHHHLNLINEPELPIIFEKDDSNETRKMRRLRKL